MPDPAVVPAPEPDRLDQVIQLAADLAEAAAMDHPDQVWAVHDRLRALGRPADPPPPEGDSGPEEQRLGHDPGACFWCEGRGASLGQPCRGCGRIRPFPAAAGSPPEPEAGPETEESVQCPTCVGFGVDLATGLTTKPCPRRGCAAEPGKPAGRLRTYRRRHPNDDGTRYVLSDEPDRIPHDLTPYLYVTGEVFVGHSTMPASILTPLPAPVRGTPEGPEDLEGETQHLDGEAGPTRAPTVRLPVFGAPPLWRLESWSLVNHGPENGWSGTLRASAVLDCDCVPGRYTCGAHSPAAGSTPPAGPAEASGVACFHGGECEGSGPECAPAVPPPGDAATEALAEQLWRAATPGVSFGWADMPEGEHEVYLDMGRAVIDAGWVNESDLSAEIDKGDARLVAAMERIDVITAERDAARARVVQLTDGLEGLRQVVQEMERERRIPSPPDNDEWDRCLDVWLPRLNDCIPAAPLGEPTDEEDGGPAAADSPSASAATNDTLWCETCGDGDDINETVVRREDGVFCDDCSPVANVGTFPARRIADLVADRDRERARADDLAEGIERVLDPTRQSPLLEALLRAMHERWDDITSDPHGPSSKAAVIACDAVTALLRAPLGSEEGKSDG